MGVGRPDGFLFNIELIMQQTYVSTLEWMGNYWAFGTLPGELLNL